MTPPSPRFFVSVEKNGDDAGINGLFSVRFASVGNAGVRGGSFGGGGRRDVQRDYSPRESFARIAPGKHASSSRYIYNTSTVLFSTGTIFRRNGNGGGKSAAIS